MLCYSIEPGISGQPKDDFCASYYSVESESLFVRSNRISRCRITVWSLKSLFVQSNRISVCRLTVLSLESLFVRSVRGGFPHVVFQC